MHIYAAAAAAAASRRRGASGGRCGDEVGGLLVDVALADPPPVVLVAGTHLAQPRRDLPAAVARLVVDGVTPRLA